jgi:hypothetical protein
MKWKYAHASHNSGKDYITWWEVNEVYSYKVKKNGENTLLEDRTRTQFLDYMGTRGWELVSVTSTWVDGVGGETVLYFKQQSN